METCVVSWVRGRETPDGRWPPAPSAASPSLQGNWSRLSLLWCSQPSPAKSFSEPSWVLAAWGSGLEEPLLWLLGRFLLGSPLGFGKRLEGHLPPPPALGITWEDRTTPLHGKWGQGRHPVGWWAGREGETHLCTAPVSQSSASAKPALKSNEHK